MSCVLAQYNEQGLADPSPGQLDPELVRGAGWSPIPGAGRLAGGPAGLLVDREGGQEERAGESG